MPSKESEVDWRSETEQRREYIEERANEALKENGVEEAMGGGSLESKNLEYKAKDLELITEWAETMR